jgi:hypothetical protein
MTDTVGASGSPEDLRREVERVVARDEASASGIWTRPYTAQVSMNIEPYAIPRETLDPAIVIARVSDELSSRFDMSEVRRLLPPESQAQLDPISAMRVAIANDRIVQFQGGWLRLESLDRITPIDKFGFGQQTLSAIVSGTTEEAEYLCKRLLLLLWHSSGVERKWSEFEEFVEISAYNTTTVVDLPSSLLGLLSDGLRKFGSDLAAAGGLAHEMGRFGSRRERYGGGTTEAVVHCLGIDLKVALFDRISGEQEECSVTLLEHTKGDANRTRIKFLSELSSSRHNDLVKALIDAVQ